MAVSTQSILPFPVTSIPDRLTPIYVADKTVNTATVGTGAVKRLNRVQSANFTDATGVTEVVEMGTQFRVGGIDELGEVTFKIDANAVSINNLAALTGQTVGATAGAVTTVGLTQWQAATIDIIRMVADPQNNIFGTLYMQDAIIDDYTLDIKEKGVASETVSGRCPNSVTFPGYIIPKVYVTNATDVTNGYVSLSTILGANEAVVALPTPSAGSPLTYWQQNGAYNFFKIEKLPAGSLAATPTRYHEYLSGQCQSAVTIATTYCTPSTFIPELQTIGNKVTMGIGTANAETVQITALASQVNTTVSTAVGAAGSTTATPASMLGIFVGVTLQCANANGTNAETVQVTAVTSTTFTVTLAQTKTANWVVSTKAPSFQATFGKTHAIADPITPYMAPSQNNVGYATYVSNKLYFGDTLVSGDAYRVVFASYNTNSYPASIPATTPDTADRAGVSARLIPIQINALGVNRCQSVQIRFSFKRDHVNGVGETSIIYGVPSVPDVAISLDFKETDLSLISQLKTGSKNLSALGGTIFNDLSSANDAVRYELLNKYPLDVYLYDPLNAGSVLVHYSSPQLVVKSVEWSSSNKADNTIRVSALDIIGNFTASYTAPQ